MSQIVKNHFNRLLHNAIVVFGTKEIIPAMVFSKLGRMSSYIEQYYMHTPRMMIMIVEPVSNPQNREYVPVWRERLLDVILLRLASTTLVAGDHYTYMNCFMARYFVDIDLLRKLALALEEGITIDEEDPNMNIDLHYLFFNLSYGTEDGNIFLCTTSQSFLFLASGKQIILFLFQIQNYYCILIRF